jgi:hypothetical protein
MRLDIKTKGPVKDKDVKALYILSAALNLSTPRMRKANLDFVLAKYGMKAETLTPNP